MNRLSKFTVLILIATLSYVRIIYLNWDTQHFKNVITWDAFGYYIYLPAIFIYDDVEKMNWVEPIVTKYNTTGNVYQLSGTLPNGNRAAKYLIGISLLSSPFFLLGHQSAAVLGFEQDGFSPPYQLAICLAALFYASIGMIALRKVLLNYYSDIVTSITLVLAVLATNYPQYVSIESGMSHGFIFALYALLLFYTVEWHRNPTKLKAFMTGLIMGVGVISRPTEIVMVFVSLFFLTQSKSAAVEKWQLVQRYKGHLLLCIIGGLVGLAPQIGYWKYVTGNWIYDVGSKWTFFDPNWNVLFGWEKGWMIYTPVAVFMVLGLATMRKNPAFKSAIIYFLLNTWIVISWFDWRYGASFSARALVQSYAVMSLPFASIIQFVLHKRISHFPIRLVFLPLLLFLTILNLFQLWQYNTNIIHYNDMNKKYYKEIFLNPHPTPLQMSLLDTEDFISNEDKYTLVNEIKIDSQFMINFGVKAKDTLFSSQINKFIDINAGRDQWLRIKASILSSWGAFDSNLITILMDNEKTKITRCRMQNALSQEMKWNTVEYYFHIPPNYINGDLHILAETNVNQNIFIKDISIKHLEYK